jgi:hypothetical protein
MIFAGADDGGIVDPLPDTRWMRWLRAAFKIGLLGSLVLLALYRFAFAQIGAPSQCGPSSVGVTAAAVTFPLAGTTGSPAPHRYLTIHNPSTATLWVNPFGGTAAASTAGSMEIAAGAYLSWYLPEFPLPVSISIVASAGGTPITCAYQ